MMIIESYCRQLLQFRPTKLIKPGDSQELEQGFTLLEALVVVFIIGILSAIAAPSWLSMLNKSRLGRAQDAVALAISEGQSRAKQRKSSWQVSFRQNGNDMEWAVHPVATPPGDNSWQHIGQDFNGQGMIRIDETKTNLAAANTAIPPWNVQFNDKGELLDPQQANQDSPQKITLVFQNGGGERCVILQTLLGNVHKTEGVDCN
ncbi:type II secretion system GspH family protein [Laspinema sp. A4]|uniref:pilus assembly FimT family protein n=1 Tax=Laspinema sp. D2d TaxID=2953686 RepID=UPI0021BA4583|nr:type II secretion system protein [Laspinema sp. D2d]MCT7982825.1 type II secretion system GspH family protein [Laspinema sp. D2d]